MNWIDVLEKEKNYKKFVGDPSKYEEIGLIIFNILKNLGLKKTSKVLDIGCGSLRVGQHLINYLYKENYYGIDPNKWLIEEALINEKIKDNKYPAFDYNDKFDLLVLDQQFDFIFANSIFIHASEKQIDTVLSQIPFCLNKDGIFLFNFIEGKNNTNDEFTYPKAVYYTKEKIISLINKYNLTYKFVDYKYPGRQKFVIVKVK